MSTSTSNPVFGCNSYDYGPVAYNCGDDGDFKISLRAMSSIKEDRVLLKGSKRRTLVSVRRVFVFVEAPAYSESNIWLSDYVNDGTLTLRLEERSIPIAYVSKIWSSAIGVVVCFAEDMRKKKKTDSLAGLPPASELWGSIGITAQEAVEKVKAAVDEQLARFRGAVKEAEINSAVFQIIGQLDDGVESFLREDTSFESLMQLAARIKRQAFLNMLKALREKRGLIAEELRHTLLVKPKESPFLRELKPHVVNAITGDKLDVVVEGVLEGRRCRLCEVAGIESFSDE